MSRFPSRALALAVVALGALAAGDARAALFGPYALVAPSSIESEDGSISVAPSGSLSFDIANVPHTSPQLFRLTDVSVQAGSFSFTLDPTLASPALGVIQPDGSFLIPTLFLRGNDGNEDFDLAIPNVRGTTFGAPNDASGLFSQFEIDASGQILRVALYAQVPEPGTLLLLALGCGALALRGRKEIAR